ncbi:ATP-binding protein [Natronospira sp.]|uniref:sensor histidine kinase n=1 Tax=Natronospira sp. TaxID=2024970 RepID=UPI003873BBD5
MRLGSLSISSQLFIVVILAVVPVLLSFIVYFSMVYSAERQRGLQQAERITDALARAHGNQFEYARSLLRVLAEHATAVSPCEPDYRRLVDESDYLFNAGVIDADGTVDCAALIADSDSDLSEASFFRRAVTAGTTVIGDAMLPFADSGRESPVIHVARAIPGKQGAVVFLALDPVESILPPALAALPESYILTLVDEDGRVLFRNVESERWVGHRVDGAQVLREQVQDGFISLVMEGLDGVERRHVAYEVSLDERGSVYAVAAVPITDDQVQAARYLKLSLILLFAALLTTAVLTYWVSRRFVRGNVSPLLKQIERIRYGMSLKDGESRPEMSREFRDLQAHLRQADEERRTTLERLRLHVEESPVAVVEWDPDFRVRGWSARAEDMFGWAAEEVLGYHPSDWRFVYEPDWPGLSGYLETITSNPRTRPQYEVRVWTRDGQLLSCAWYTSVIRDSQGQPESFLSFIVDVSARADAEEALLRLNESLEWRVAERTRELELANRELESFSYSVSHDLRAPLRAIDGFAQALEEDFEAQLDGAAGNYLQRIRAAARRMGALIDDLLRLARVSQADLRVEIISLSDLASEICLELQENNPEHEVAWFVEPGLAVSADRALARMALENLIENAWKFTRGKEQPRVELKLVKRDDGGSCFELWDNGAGFDQRYVDRIFEPFQRLHSGQEFEGTGIGLATVRRVMERHQGWIQAESDEGGGARFLFCFGFGVNQCSQPGVEDER